MPPTTLRPDALEALPGEPAQPPLRLLERRRVDQQVVTEAPVPPLRTGWRWVQRWRKDSSARVAANSA